ncbi:MAG: leucine--tRNA ligase, partial [Calditrichota bacterium]
QATAAAMSEMDRTAENREKTGVWTGSYAINPVNDQKIPIWIADYVLATYGTGAIMAVPGHDERDWEFAKTFDLPIVEVIEGGDVTEAAWSGDGKLVNSETSDVSLNGLSVADAKRKITDWLEKAGIGEGKINYKLRDWLFSRQRYWGEPFPVLHDPDGNTTALDESDLPLRLPEMEDFKPTPVEENEQPKPPLGRAPDSWKFVERGGVVYTREFNTMPQWAGSCWYYLRYIDPLNDKAFLDPEKEKYWMPVDLYVGGAEHAVLHLLYARFWHKVLYDLGHVSTVEPFQKLVNQGMILGEMEFTLYRDASGKPVSAQNVVPGDIGENGNPYAAHTLSSEDAVKKGDGFVWKEDENIRIEARAHKMSKSRGNVINPDTVVEAYGADSLRLYEMFMGPLEQVKPWSMKGVEGVHRFLKRTWRLVINLDGEIDRRIDDADPTKDQLFHLHTMLKKVTEDLDGMRFNTAIAAMMSFLNEAMKWDNLPKSVVSEFLVALSPFAPHIAEELNERLGNSETLAYHTWPKFDESHLKQDTTEIVIQVNGKLRQRLQLEVGLSKEKLQEIAMADERISGMIEGKEIIRVIAVPNKLVNIVVKG